MLLYIQKQQILAHERNTILLRKINKRSYKNSSRKVLPIHYELTYIFDTNIYVSRSAIGTWPVVVRVPMELSEIKTMCV